MKEAGLRSSVRVGTRRGTASPAWAADSDGPRTCSGGVLVAFAADDDAGAPLDVGVVLARERRARLSVLAVAREGNLGWCCAPTIAPMSLWTSPGQGVALAHRRCREAVREVVGDVPVDYRVVCGRPRDVVASLLAEGHFIAVVLPRPWMASRRMRRAARRWQEQGIAVHAAWADGHRIWS